MKNTEHFKIKPLKWRRRGETITVADLVFGATLVVTKTIQSDGPLFEYEVRGFDFSKEIELFDTLADAKDAAEAFWQIELKKVLSK